MGGNVIDQKGNSNIMVKIVHHVLNLKVSVAITSESNAI